MIFNKLPPLLFKTADAAYYFTKLNYWPSQYGHGFFLPLKKLNLSTVWCCYFLKRLFGS